jgi:hypothetical protein
MISEYKPRRLQRAKDTSRVKAIPLDKYIVYKVTHNSKVIYIGSGLVGRDAHVTSGCSHVYELNRLHFQGVVPDVEVVFRGSKEDTLHYEKGLIISYKPTFNKKHNPNFNFNTKVGLKERWVEYFSKLPTDVKRRQCLRALDAMLTEYGICGLTTGKGIYIKDICRSRTKIPHYIMRMCYYATVPSQSHYYKEIYDIVCADKDYLFLPSTVPGELSNKGA